ncbi:MAG: DNA alkylation repair protein [Bacteroidetes bacterium]|nr:DNA alkylation repair protein [Bacteroidota bacterium]
MQSITRKGDIQQIVADCLQTYQKEGLSACSDYAHSKLLSFKVRFPLLEYAGHLLFEGLAEKNQFSFCQHISDGKTEGGNVLIGIILQNRLSDVEQTFAKAAQYIMAGTEWYVCDIIGERVFGYGLLTRAEACMPLFKKYIDHESPWVVRALGAGSHYAVKKGLPKEEVRGLFDLLLQQANTKEKEIRQGIGWAAKTCAKFHPDVIESYRTHIENENHVANWFRRKIEIGLERSR